MNPLLKLGCGLVVATLPLDGHTGLVVLLNPPEGAETQRRQILETASQMGGTRWLENTSIATSMPMHSPRIHTAGHMALVDVFGAAIERFGKSRIVQGGQMERLAPQIAKAVEAWTKSLSNPEMISFQSAIPLRLADQRNNCCLCKGGSWHLSRFSPEQTCPNRHILLILAGQVILT